MRRIIRLFAVLAFIVTAREQARADLILVLSPATQIGNPGESVSLRRLVDEYWRDRRLPERNSLEWQWSISVERHAVLRERSGFADAGRDVHWTLL
jgi:hypothetical protein